MEWKEMFPAHSQPDMSQIGTYTGISLWEGLCSFVEGQYHITPKIEYSICSMAPGWNVKYKKGGKAVCTLYPNDGFYTCLLSVGNQAASETELILAGCTPYVQELYWKTNVFNGGRWLMINVTEEAILEDVKELIGIRVKSWKKPASGNNK